MGCRGREAGWRGLLGTFLEEGPGDRRCHRRATALTFQSTPSSANGLVLASHSSPSGLTRQGLGCSPTGLKRLFSPKKKSGLLTPCCLVTLLGLSGRLSEPRHRGTYTHCHACVPCHISTTNTDTSLQSTHTLSAPSQWHTATGTLRCSHTQTHGHNRCCCLHCVPLKTCGSPNPPYLGMWPQLERGSLEM